jgi:tRNA nucleotidyltransferase (CCA-adding enzyme)
MNRGAQVTSDTQSTIAVPTAEDLLEQLGEQPGGEDLLAQAPPDAHLVGGAVRDLLLQRTPHELDVTVVGGKTPFGAAATKLATALAARMDASATVSVHERFGTAVVAWERGRIDIATARRERYPAPGALPEVEPGSLQEDLKRRDFTVNAIAMALGGERAGKLCAVPNAFEDLRAGRLRVLHDLSFREDPTRLLRLARYQARLGFAIEEHTAGLARGAIAADALRTVSGARVGAELRLALGERDAIATLTALQELGVLAALHPKLSFDAKLAGNALRLLAGAAEGDTKQVLRPDLLLLAIVLQPLAEDEVEEQIATLLHTLEFPASDSERVLHATLCAAALEEELARTETGSEIYKFASCDALETIALAGAIGELRFSDAGVSAYRWLSELHRVHLRITGDDLLAAGVPEGPEIGRRLRETLLLRLDDELPDEREPQLQAALAVR